MSLFTFKKNYFGVALLLFVLEVLIALYVHDDWIRPFVGDILVVLLIYCSIKSVLEVTAVKAAAFTLLLSCTLEFLQRLNLVHVLGLTDSKIAQNVLGTSFSWMDIAMYFLGTAIVLLIEGSRKVGK